jgi:hypothetical protein
MPSTSVKRRDRPRRDTRTFSARLVRGLWILAGLASVVAFAVIVDHITLSPQPGAGKYVHDNTHPGETLRFYLDRPSIRAALLQIGGNFVLLMPLGVLLPVLTTRLRGPLRILLVVAIISLGIETAQGTLIVGRAFDADDVLLNTAGAVVAYLVAGRKVAGWAHR